MVGYDDECMVFQRSLENHAFIIIFEIRGELCDTIAMPCVTFYVRICSLRQCERLRCKRDDFAVL